MKTLKTIIAIFTLLFYSGCGVSELQSYNINFTSTQKEEGSKVLDVDTSGMMVDYGGQLINKRQSLFCTHWNIVGKEVTFIARNGEKVKRIVLGMNRLGNDLCIVTFDKDLDPKQHWIAPVADIKGVVEVTVFRYKDRKPISVEVAGDVFFHGLLSAEYNIFECVPGKSVRPGDSGKGWYAEVDGKIYLVGINSFVIFGDNEDNILYAFSPEVGELFKPYQWQLK